MKKNVLCSLLSISLLASIGTVYAEHPKAEYYRNVINSNKFYMEYDRQKVYDYSKIKDPNVIKHLKRTENNQSYLIQVLAVDNTRRISYKLGTALRNRNLKVQDKKSIKNQNKLMPSVLYQNKKYYQFQDAKNAIVLDEKDINSDKLNAMQFWHQSKLEVLIPLEFLALVPDNVLVNNPGINGTIKFKFKSKCIESGKKDFIGKLMYYDKYELTTYVDVNNNGKMEATPYKDIYFYYYDENGNLSYIDTKKFQNVEYVSTTEGFTLKGDEAKEYLKSFEDKNQMKYYFKVNKITDEIPANFFDIPKGTKVYAADTGTMADLLGTGKLVEEY